MRRTRNRLRDQWWKKKEKKKTSSFMHGMPVKHHGLLCLHSWKLTAKACVVWISSFSGSFNFSFRMIKKKSQSCTLEKQFTNLKVCWWQEVFWQKYEIVNMEGGIAGILPTGIISSARSLNMCNKVEKIAHTYTWPCYCNSL